MIKIYEPEKILIKAFIQEGIQHREAVRLTNKVIKIYIRYIILEALNLYFNTGDMKYISLIKTLVHYYAYNERKRKLYKKKINEPIAEAVLSVLFEEHPPEKIAKNFLKNRTFF